MNFNQLFASFIFCIKHIFYLKNIKITLYTLINKSLKLVNILSINVNYLIIVKLIYYFIIFVYKIGLLMRIKLIIHLLVETILHSIYKEGKAYIVSFIWSSAYYIK